LRCDIIVPVWNQPEFTRECIEHVMENTAFPYRLILVDNASAAETRDYLEGLKDKKNVDIALIKNKENLGFIKAVNQGLKISDAPYVCVLNNDTLPASGWLSELVEFAEKHSDVGLLNPLCGGHIQRNMTVNEYASFISASNKNKYMEMNQCQGFAMLIKRDLIEKIGRLDEKFGMGGFDDTDYSMRAHLAGYRSVCVYSSYVYHREHVSFDSMGDRKKIQAESEKRYFGKWPHHRRVAVIFSVSKKTTENEIWNMLNLCLFLARKWCWINLMVYGNKHTRATIDAAQRKMGFPLHQNIKLNILKSRVRPLDIPIRILERSFGRKKRKRYNAVIYGERKTSPLLEVLCNIHKCRLLKADFNKTRPWEQVFQQIMAGTGPFGGDGSHYRVESQGDTDIRTGSGPAPIGSKCDIILPVCDQFDFTKKCIESIVENTDSPFRLIIINNGKNPDTRRLLDELQRNPDVETTIVHNARNIGWVKALNKGIELSSAPYICFQNDDTIVTQGWLRKMINILNLKPEFGLINPSWEGRPAAFSIDAFNTVLEKRGRERFVETDWCRGFSVVIKRAVVEKIGKVDEIYGLAYFDDVDYSVCAIEAGFIALVALDTYVYHHRNVTFFEVLKGPRWNELHEKNKLIYYKKWGKPLKLVITLNKKTLKDNRILDRVEETAFYLARKQHHVEIWSPRAVSRRFRHTNMRIRVYGGFLMKILPAINLYSNKRKKTDKKYNAVFKDVDRSDFPRLARETVDRIKEKTKELIHAGM